MTSPTYKPNWPSREDWAVRYRRPVDDTEALQRSYGMDVPFIISRYASPEEVKGSSKNCNNAGTTSAKNCA